MDKEKPKSIYPEPNRGNFAKEQTTRKLSQRFGRVHDYSTTSIIVQLVAICLFIGVAGLATYFYTFRKANESTPSVIAYAFANKMTDLKTTQSSEELNAAVRNALEKCNAPIITIVHRYDPKTNTKRTDETLIYTSKVENVTLALEDLVDKVDGTASNNMYLSCPI